jgi:hypothetical protein
MWDPVAGIFVLGYFQYGTSFLTDSLHTIYSGAFKQLLRLLFDYEYRSKPWSLYNKINRIDELLSHIQNPSTTQRRFRSIEPLSRYKASEYRCLFHFGTPAILECTKENIYKNLLLSVITAINLASADLLRMKQSKWLRNYFVILFNNLKKYSVDGI